MHFLALALDYDGTIAENGSVPECVYEALETLRRTGRKTLLVTGRELQSLKHRCPRLDAFDLVIAENGALLYSPWDDTEELIAEPASVELVRVLRAKGIPNLSVGQSVIGTWRPYEEMVISAIGDLGLELQMTFNRDAIMILPPSVNKASGLRAALNRLGISEVPVVGAGDAENDHSFLSICGCAAAVGNAIASIKADADVELTQPYGAGVCELVEMLIEKDVQLVAIDRTGLNVGKTTEAHPVWLRAESVMLVLGNSGSGKSSYVTWLTERMVEARQEFCVIDPEGDYLTLKNAVTIGGLTVPPTTEESVHHLLQAQLNVVVSTIALDHPARVQLFGELLPFIQQLRSASGRPYWLIVDEAHYMLPYCARWPEKFLGGVGTVLVALDFDQVCPTLVSDVNVLVALGSTARDAIERFARQRQRPCPQLPERLPGNEYACLWNLDEGDNVVLLEPVQPAQRHYRHSGKYVTGNVGPWHAFYFPALAQRAENLTQFILLAKRLDDAALRRHLEAGDFTNWFRHVIRDDVLANKTHLIEVDPLLEPREALRHLEALVRSRYRI